MLLSVSTVHPHSRLIQQAAREILAPIGIFQRGRSRLWLDGHGWWLIMIEFQPSSWSKGSCLNVGAHWLWKEHNSFSFDVGYREEVFVQFESESQFQPEAHRLAHSARCRVLELRHQFPTISAAAEFLKRQAATSHNPWQLFDAGIALGYIGATADSLACFNKLLAQEATYDWEHTLHAKTHDFAALLTSPAAFRARIDEAILTTRKLLKMSGSPPALLGN